MLGRGIDQIFPHPSPPRLYEAHVKSAVTCLGLAEAASGPIPRRVAPEYVWGPQGGDACAGHLHQGLSRPAKPGCG
jgi:hypothetical protein